MIEKRRSAYLRKRSGRNNVQLAEKNTCLSSNKCQNCIEKNTYLRHRFGLAEKADVAEVQQWNPELSVGKDRIEVRRQNMTPQYLMHLFSMYEKY